MAESDNLYIGWELRGKLEQQIKDAVKDAERLQDAIEKVQAAGEKIDASKGKKNIEKNAREATDAVFKMTEALEKANQAISRNTAHRNEDLWGFDDARLQRSVARLSEIIDKVMNIGAESALAGNAVKNLLASLDANLVMKEVKSGTRTLVGQLDKEEKERAKAAKDAAKEMAKAEKDAEDAAARNATAQQKVQDALSRIATARSQLAAVNATAGQQEQMHVQLLLSLLDRLSQKLASLKGTDLSAKGALAGVLGSGYVGLMRNVSTTIGNVGKEVLGLEQSSVNMLMPKNVEEAVNNMERLAKSIVKLREDIKDTKKQLSDLEEGESQGRYFPKEKELLNKRLESQKSDLEKLQIDLEANAKIANAFSEQMRFMNNEAQHIEETFGSAGAAAQRHAARQRELSETFGAYFDEIERKERRDAEAKEAQAKALDEQNKKLKENENIQKSLDKLNLDTKSQQVIAGVRRQNSEYDALSNKLRAIADLQGRVNDERSRMQANPEGYGPAIYTRERVQQELDAIQRQYNEDLAKGRELERLDAEAKEAKAKAARDAAQAVREQALANQGLASAYERAAEMSEKQSRITTQLQQQLAGYFGLYSAEHFLKNLIQIGGEFEVQHIALQNILGDVQQANSMFEQMKELAVVSPFNFRQLAGYAKQVAAFNVPYSEMFDTTKRLADISAGLGVDMGRLILAFGQVRSAAVLRGQELRQFTEAGIPLVQALANEFTRLNGRAVSTAEVFDLISKRAVPFEMVKKILWDMTNEGGRFFDTQFVLSDTLAGKWSNLQDAWEIMLSEMADGEKYGGQALKVFVSLTTSLIENMNTLLPLISGMAAAYSTIKFKNWVSRFGDMGFKGIDANIKKAQQLRAIELTRQKINGEITGHQYAQLMRMNAQKGNYYQVLAMEGKMNALQIQRVYQQGNLNKKQLEYLVLMGRITAEQRKQIILNQLSMNNWARMGNAIKGFGRNLWAMTGWTGVVMIGIEAAIAGFMTWKSHLDEIARKNKDLIGSFSNRGKELSDTISGMTGTPFSNDEYKSAIDGMKEILKQHVSNYGSVMREVNAVGSLKEQYEKLKAELADTKKVYEAAEGIAQDFGSDTRNLFDDAKTQLRDFNKSVFKDSEHFEKAIKDTATNIADVIKSYVPRVGKDKSSNELYRQLRNAMEEELGFGGRERMQLNIELDKILNITGGSELSNLVLEKFSEAVDLTEKGIANKIRYGQGLNKAEQDKVQELMNAAIKDVEKQYPYLHNTLQGLLNNSHFTATVRVMFAEDNMGNSLQQQVYKNFPSVANERIKTIATNWAKNGTSVYDARNRAKKDIDAVYNELIARKDMLEKGKITAEEVQKTKQEYDDNVAAALAGLGYDYEGEKKKSNKESKGGSKTDEQLKRWKEEWGELKAFYSEYKKWAQQIGNDAALKKLRETGLWGQFFNADGSTVYGMSDWGKVIGDFRKKLSGGTTERTKFLFEVSKEQLTPQYDEIKKAAEAILSQLDAALKEQGKKWNLYKKVLEATGDKSQAAQLAFGGQIDFGNQAEQLRSEIAKALLGNSKAQGFSIDKLLGMNDEALRNIDIFKENTDGVYQRLMALKDAEQQLKSEDVELFLDALKNAKSLETELAQIENKYNRTRNAIKANGGDPTLLENANKNEAREKADARWKYFKQDEDWGRIFGNLDKMSTQTLRNMRDNLTALLPNITASEEATKALYEALAKIDQVVTQRNPFSAIGNALGKASRLPAYSKQAGKGDIVANSELSKLLGVQLGSKVTKKQIDDERRGAEEDFVKGLDGISKKFKAVQDVLQPVIDLFDQLGMKEASEFFQTGSNALGAASQVAGGLNALGLGSLGPYGAAAAAGISMVSSIFALHDKALQEEIDASKQRQKEMENLTKNLETALERTLGGVYNTKASAGDIKKLQEYQDRYTMQSIFRRFGLGSFVKDDTSKAVSDALSSETYYDTKLAELYIQRDEIRKQMELEQDKKNSDGGAIEDYKQQLAEMQDQIENFALDMAKAIYDIDIKSWAKDLSDAVVTAWENGEDAVEAYTNTVKSKMKDLSKNILAQKVMEKALDNAGIDEIIAKMMDSSNGKLDLSVVPQLATALGEAGNKSVAAITAALDELERQGYINKGDGTSSSSTSKAIQGSFTEQETGLLVSYINSIRADVSTNRITMDKILTAVLGMSSRNMLTEAQESYLRNIAAYTKRNADAAEAIYELLHRVSPDGQSIKVK